MSNREDEVRVSAFLWLKERSAFNGEVFDRAELANGFRYQGEVVTLIGPSGIWFPKGFTTPISIATTTGGPYEDGFNDEGFLDYRYRGTDPNHRDNVGLRTAYLKRSPLIYFHSIVPGKYVAVWPIFILSDEPQNLRIRAAIEPALDIGLLRSSPALGQDLQGDSSLGVRRYITAVTKQRLHQTAFREFVLSAYDRQCSMCRLQHPELLDAAHIIPDSEPRGDAVVTNGLSLCKIHHAAYDQNIIGISPDYVIRVREDILQEVDGPMLKYGLQSMEGRSLNLPVKKAERPDRDRLDWRYQKFVS